MKVNILASGSSGNCIALTSGLSTILIDCGIAKTKIEKRLLEVGIQPNNIEAIFITHAHSDHIKGLPLANKYNIPVYAGDDEWKGIKNVNEGLKETISMVAYIKGIKILAFHVHHDAYEPLGYAIMTQEYKVSVCLDTGRVDTNMLNAMQNSDIYIIEANHEPNMVEACNRPPSVKARVLSDIGHLSNKQTAEALSKLVQGKGEKIYLTHLSNDNNMPTLAEMTIKQALSKKGFFNKKQYEIEVF